MVQTGSQVVIFLAIFRFLGEFRENRAFKKKLLSARTTIPMKYSADARDWPHRGRIIQSVLDFRHFF